MFIVGRHIRRTSMKKMKTHLEFAGGTPVQLDGLHQASRDGELRVRLDHGMKRVSLVKRVLQGGTHKFDKSHKFDSYLISI